MLRIEIFAIFVFQIPFDSNCDYFHYYKLILYFCDLIWIYKNLHINFIYQPFSLFKWCVINNLMNYYLKSFTLYEFCEYTLILMSEFKRCWRIHDFRKKKITVKENIGNFQKFGGNSSKSVGYSRKSWKFVYFQTNYPSLFKWCCFNTHRFFPTLALPTNTSASI